MSDEPVQVCPDDNGPHRCRYCGENFPERNWNEGFESPDGRFHWITGPAGILSGEQRYQSDGRRVRTGDKPVVVEVGAPDDDEDEAPVVVPPVQIYPKAPELSAHERYKNFVLGPIGTNKGGKPAAGGSSDKKSFRII